MALPLLAAFVAVPLVEIAAFVEVGGRLGLWPTLAVVVATAVAGSALLRGQGLRVWRRFRGGLGRGELPVAEALDGLCLLVSGVLLVTPGFFTDLAGFALLAPPLRRAVARALLARVAPVRGAGAAAPPGAPDGPVIDGEFEEVDHDRTGRR